MKVGYKKVLIIEILFFILLLLFNFVFKMNNSYSVIIILNLFFLILIISLLGYEKDNFRYKKDVLLTVSIGIILYFIVMYVGSFYIGYLKTGYSLKLINIVKNIFPVLLIIVFSELNRYCLVTKSKGYKFGFVFLIVIMIFIDVYYKIDFLSGSQKKVVEFLVSVFIPSIFKNIFLTYLTYKVGFISPIVYRLIFELNKFILPVFPGYGIYLQSVFDVLFPFIMFIIIYNSFEKEKNKKIDVRNNNLSSNVITIIMGLLLIIIITLSSGLFRYYSVSVASNSMKDYIHKGDIIIVQKYNKKDIDNLKIGEILFYEKENKLVSHRIIGKYEDNETIYFQTKGDNNVTKDNYYVYEDEIRGKIVLRIRFLGWPSVWLSQLLNER